MPRELMTNRETAAYLGVAEQTLHNWRHQRKGPRHYRVGQLVKYALADVDAWLEEHASDHSAA